LISGLPGNEIEDVKLNNIRIYYRPIDSPLSRIQKVVPEYEKVYPEPQKFGVLPAYGFFIRHVKNIELNNVEISFMGKETRPAFILDDVKGADFFRVKAQKAATAPLYQLKNVEGFTLKDGGEIPDKKITKTHQLAF
jgi:hypothetical protein